MDDASSKRVGVLRRRAHELELEVRRLEGQVAHLEKQLEHGPEEGAVGKRLGELQLSLDGTQRELDQVRDELEGSELARAADAESTDELELLVDSFAATAAGVPELSNILSAMKLCVGALATAQRLHRAHGELTEVGEITRALGAALQLLAQTLTTASGRELAKQ
jgi:chromosome segregation ATPase